MAQLSTPHVSSYPGPSRLRITGALVQWLRAHFQDPNNLEDQDLAKAGTEMVWSPDRATKLVIESITRYDPKQIEQRPALIAKPNAWMTSRLSIGNRLQGFTSSSGTVYRVRMVEGSHTVFCLAGEGGECEKLADETHRELEQFADVVREHLGLVRLEAPELGDMALIEEASQRYVIPIPLVYAFERAWKVTPRSAVRLQTINWEWKA
ncbi:MAG: hypothetical protein E6G97_17930 [Alphaproteobacteria bacterium]|nr:MAG: hypothetical protein E6G97_17930 [Alphaproteobacteria bacterium]